MVVVTRGRVWLVLSLRCVHDRRLPYWQLRRRAAGSDCFVRCDDRIVGRCGSARIQVINPVEFALLLTGRAE